ncbi:hypothetical protein GCM10009530_27290 [Microbispora corallina]|uniref:Integral membrane protein n=2 Tax=Microbispora corallina TaxID=83302 RepID=A0ABQ4FZ58_9ACTN|nr:hypothetical protein Mco01_31140 [Microbispora corallina]
MVAMAAPAAVAVALQVALYAAAAWAVTAWARQTGWGGGQRVALAAGALLTYAWHAFLSRPVVDSTPALDLTSHVVLGLGAAALAAAAYRSARLRPRPVVSRT